VNARRVALGLVMAEHDNDQQTARTLLAGLNRTELEDVALSLASFAIEIVAPDERAGFRLELADEALGVAGTEDLEGDDNG
jgi:hypothetical protein